MLMRTFAALCLALIELLGVVATTGAEPASPRAPSPVAAAGDFSGLVDIGSGRRLWLECRGEGIPTVVLEAGFRADLWSDDVFLGGAVSQERLRAQLEDLVVLWVGVRCDPEIAAGREIARGDRVTGMAASQAEMVHKGVIYDVEVDTSRTETLDCARAIAARVVCHSWELPLNRPCQPPRRPAGRRSPRDRDRSASG